MKATIQINFKKDLLEILRLASIKYGYKSRNPNALDQSLYSWLEYNKRLVPAAPRKSFFSKEILSSEFFGNLSNIVAKSENGEDLNGFLSTDAEILKKPDMLLFDWDIKHFHFDNYKENSTTKKRSSELVFFRQFDDAIYFIQIGAHQFSDIELLEIINRNWPNQITKLGGIKPTKNVTSEELHRLRQAGITVSPSLEDGTVVFGMGGGYSTARTSSNLQMHTMHILQNLDHFEKECRKEVAKAFIKIGTSKFIVRGKLGITEKGELEFRSSNHSIHVSGPKIF